MDPIAGWPTWNQDALCRTRPFEHYDLDHLSPNPQTRSKQAKAACEGCPVIRDCALDALRYDTRGVVRGGYAWPESASYVVEFRNKVAKSLGVPPVKLAESRDKPRECKNGHPFNAANTKVRDDGSRLCMECRRQAHRRSNAKLAERRRAKRVVAA